MARKDDFPVTLKVTKEYIKKSEGLVAYIVNRKGALMEDAHFNEGEAILKTKLENIKGQATIYLAPEIPSKMKRKKVDENLLKKLGAYQPLSRLIRGNIININFIPDFEKFIFNICNITGTLQKTFNINGQSETLPVCDVRVHICEVDRLYLTLPKIPVEFIWDIRDKLLDLIFMEELPRRPFPEPDPLPNDPIRRMKMPSNTRKISLDKKIMERKLIVLPELPDNVISGLSSDSIEKIKDTLIHNFDLIHPYFCFYPKFWPFLYTCSHIATVYPDCNGRFEYLYWNFEIFDKPDIYIWVEANIDGVWQTVYKPSKACHTYWNYACGTDINIVLTDSRILPCSCSPFPGQVVWMKRINNGVSIRNIQQNTNPSGHLANAIGLTDYAGVNVSPFGLSFPIYVQFGSGFPSSSITHFRWRYRRLQDAALNNVTESESSYDGLISKGYTYERVNSDGDTVFYTGSFDLGPVFTANGPAYKIPHSEASIDVPAEPTAEWSYQDTNSINVNSPDLGDGLFEFIFELLDNNGVVVAQDPDVFVVDKKAGELSNPPDAPTISANNVTENYVLKNGSNKAIGFRFVIRIDNNACYAEIYNALVDGSPTETECGFGAYNNKTTSQVTLRFEASHPQDFATYNFSVVKGNGNSAGPTNTSGYVTVANDGYGVSSDVYSKNVGVAQMLGICDQAAFAENLHVRATHTNGNTRIQEYDRSDVAAFAIEPAPPSSGGLP